LVGRGETPETLPPPLVAELGVYWGFAVGAIGRGAIGAGGRV
jgi:hypothetical protein